MFKFKGSAKKQSIVDPAGGPDGSRQAELHLSV
jgi:hypothetical protein